MTLVGKRPIRRDDAYLDFVRCKPCAICGKPPPSDPHHLISRRWREAFREDYVTIPMCRVDHSVIETVGFETALLRWKMTGKDLAIIVADLLVEWFAGEPEVDVGI